MENIEKMLKEIKLHREPPFLESDPYFCREPWRKFGAYFDGYCGVYCSAQCYADAHATVKVLDEDEADNCSCDILDDDAIEKEKSNIQKEISEKGKILCL